MLEQKFEKLIKELDNVKAEKEKSDARLDQSKSQLQSAMKDLEKVRHRCDELATESSSAMEEKTKLMESLAVAKKEAQNSRRGDSSGRSRGSNGSNFTVDQLSTHLSVLKRRLACPVCNDRDKACILLRCRHMFCKHCVDENIKVSCHHEWFSQFLSCTKNLHCVIYPIIFLRIEAESALHVANVLT